MNLKKCKKLRMRLRTFVNAQDREIPGHLYVDQTDAVVKINQIARNPGGIIIKKDEPVWKTQKPQTINIYRGQGTFKVHQASVRGVYKMLKKQFDALPMPGMLWQLHRAQAPKAIEPAIINPSTSKKQKRIAL